MSRTVRAVGVLARERKWLSIVGAGALLLACGARPDAAAPRGADAYRTGSSSRPAPVSPSAAAASTAASDVDPEPPVATGARIAVIADQPDDAYNLDVLGSAVLVLDAGHMHRVEGNSLIRDAIPTKGLPVDGNGGRHSWARGVWPGAAFLVHMELDEMGFEVPSLFAHDARAHAWRPLMWKGHFRAGIVTQPSSDKTWLGVRSGFGAGGYIPIEVATLGPGPVLSKPLLLPCQSGSEVISSAAGEGHVFVVCHVGEKMPLLHLAPGAPRTTEVVGDVREAFGPSFSVAEAVLFGPRRLLIVHPSGERLGLLEIGDGEPRATLLPFGRLGSSTNDDRSLWLVEDLAPAPRRRLWQIAIERDRIGTATPFPMPPGIERVETASGGVLWFSGRGALYRRSQDGAWARYALPEGAKLAAATPDGGAWIDGSIVGRIAPRSEVLLRRHGDAGPARRHRRGCPALEVLRRGVEPPRRPRRRPPDARPVTGRRPLQRHHVGRRVARAKVTARDRGEGRRAAPEVSSASFGP